jgi:hypothetical protein
MYSATASSQFPGSSGPKQEDTPGTLPGWRGGPDRRSSSGRRRRRPVGGWRMKLSRVWPLISGVDLHLQVWSRTSCRVLPVSELRGCPLRLPRRYAARGWMERCPGARRAESSGPSPPSWLSRSGARAVRAGQGGPRATQPGAPGQLLPSRSSRGGSRAAPTWFSGKGAASSAHPPRSVTPRPGCTARHAGWRPGRRGCRWRPEDIHPRGI